MPWLEAKIYQWRRWSLVQMNSSRKSLQQQRGILYRGSAKLLGNQNLTADRSGFSEEDPPRCSGEKIQYEWAVYAENIRLYPSWKSHKEHERYGRWRWRCRLPKTPYTLRACANWHLNIAEDAKTRKSKQCSTHPLLWMPFPQASRSFSSPTRNHSGFWDTYVSRNDDLKR